MSNGTPPTALKSRLVGLVLVCIGGVFLYYFVKSPIGGLPGFPQAWRGGPLLLGASFFTINGFFLIFQKRFSLGAFLISGFMSAALTSGTHAYVRSIRETTTVDNDLDLPTGILTKFIGRSRVIVTPNRLRQIVEDADSSGWISGGIDFENAFVTFGSRPGQKNRVVVTLNIETCPFVHPFPGYARHISAKYCYFVHLWIADSLSERTVSTEELDEVFSGSYYEDHPEHVLFQLIDMLVDAKGTLRYATSANYQKVWFQARRDALEWLRDHETNPELKSYLTRMLESLDKLIAHKHL